MQNFKYFRHFFQGMFNAEYIVYLCVYINTFCICKNNTANYLKFGQQLLGLTLRVNP